MPAALPILATDLVDDLPDIAPDPRLIPPGRAMMARLISLREQTIRRFAVGGTPGHEIRPDGDRCALAAPGIRYGWHHSGFGHVPMLLILIGSDDVVWLPQRIAFGENGSLLLHRGRDHPILVDLMPLPIHGILRREPVVDVMLARGASGMVLRRRIWMEDGAGGQ